MSVNMTLLEMMLERNEEIKKEKQTNEIDDEIDIERRFKL